MKEIVKKEFRILWDMPLPNGRSYYIVECPFCLAQFQMQKWGMRRGKKCDCGAHITFHYAKREGEEV